MHASTWSGGRIANEFHSFRKSVGLNGLNRWTVGRWLNAFVNAGHRPHRLPTPLTPDAHNTTSLHLRGRSLPLIQG